MGIAVYGSALTNNRRYWPCYIDVKKAKVHFTKNGVGAMDALRGELENVPLYIFTATSKGTELSYELNYAISFWSWILSWKYFHFVEISTFHGYYPHFVEISTFRGYYPNFVYISVFCGNIHVLWILSAFLGNIHVPWRLSAFCVCIRIYWKLSAFGVNIHVPWILSAFFPFYLSYFTHLMKVTGESLLLVFVT